MDEEVLHESGQSTDKQEQSNYDRNQINITSTIPTTTMKTPTVCTDEPTN